MSGAGTSDGTGDPDGPADGDTCGRAGAGDVGTPAGDGLADVDGSAEGAGIADVDGTDDADGTGEGDGPSDGDAAGADPMAAPPPPTPAPVLPGGVEGPPPTGAAGEPGEPAPAALVEPGTWDATFVPGGVNAASAPIAARIRVTRATAAVAMSAREGIPGRVLGSRRGPRSARIARSQ